MNFIARTRKECSCVCIRAQNPYENKQLLIIDCIHICVARAVSNKTCISFVCLVYFPTHFLPDEGYYFIAALHPALGGFWRNE